jgi:hypothetical protein
LGSLFHTAKEGRMKKVLGLVGATLMFAGPALAADLAVKAPALAGPLPAQWGGFYLGIHGGYGWGHDSGDTSPFSNPSPKGGVFGGQAGYNWQYGSFVGGLEVDFSGADLKHSQSITATAVGDGTRVSETISVSTKVDYFGSARARAGLLLTPIGCSTGLPASGGRTNRQPARQASRSTVRLCPVSQTPSSTTISDGRQAAAWNTNFGKISCCVPNICIMASAR